MRTLLNVPNLLKRAVVVTDPLERMQEIPLFAGLSEAQCAWMRQRMHAHSYPAGVDIITDPDLGAADGIAIISADNTNGAWQFSLDNGSTWNPLGSPSSSAAVTTRWRCACWAVPKTSGAAWDSTGSGRTGRSRRSATTARSSTATWGLPRPSSCRAAGTPRSSDPRCLTAGYRWCRQAGPVRHGVG